MKVGRKLFITVFLAIIAISVGLCIYIFGKNDSFRNFFSNPADYSITFTVEKDGQEVVVKEEKYNVESLSIEEPEVPSKLGYEGKWETYSLDNGGNLVVKAIYTPINYNLTFVGPLKEGVQEQYRFTYNILGETTMEKEPAVPSFGLSFDGQWDSYQLKDSTGDIIVNALYTSKGATFGIEYTYNSADDTYAVKKYNGEAIDVVIPEVYKNKKVTAIEKDAFTNNNTMLSLTLPKTMKKINAGSFQNCNKLFFIYNCSSLNIKGGEETERSGIAKNVTEVFDGVKTEETDKIIKYSNFYFTQVNGKWTLVGYGGNTDYITLPQSLTNQKYELNAEEYEVGDYALYNNTSIKSITIPNSSFVTKIGKEAFAGCSSLEKFELGSVKELDYSALNGCCNLKTINVSGLNTNYFVRNGCLFNRPESNGDKLTIIKAVVSANLPVAPSISDGSLTGQVDSINSYAFEGNQVEKLNIEQFYSNIGNGAFRGCNNLKELTINNYMPQLIGLLFEDFSLNDEGGNIPSVPASLEKVTINKGSTTEFKDNVICDNAFFGCDSIKEIIISDSVLEIGQNAFGSCASLEKLTIPVIGDQNSQQLSYNFGYQIPTSLSNIIVTNEDYIAVSAFSGFSNVKSIVIEKAESFEYNSFVDCDSLEEVTLPFIGYSVDDNTSFSSVFNKVPQTLEKVTIKGGKLKDSAFSGCSSIKEIILPANVLPKNGDGKEYIPSFAFYNCTSLVKWPTNINSAVSIESNAFTGFNKGETLEKLVFNKEFPYLEKIGQNAFSNSTSLKSVTLNSKITFVGTDAFAECTNLEFNTDKDGNKYLGANDNDFYALIEIGDKTVRRFSVNNATIVIAGGAGRDCETLFSLTLNKNLKNISNDAFVDQNPIYEVYNLCGITIYDKHSELYNENGINCQGLYKVHSKPETTEPSIVQEDQQNDIITIVDGSVKEIVRFMNNNITEVSLDYEDTGYIIKANVFAKSNITNLVITRGVATIEDNAFCDCQNLKNVVIKNISSIGNSCFQGCTALEEVAISGTISTIPNSAFRDCYSLTDVSLPKTINTIGDYAFYGCNSLTTITDFNTMFKGSSAHIGSYAFTNTSLSELFIKNNITLQYNSFYNNKQLMLLFQTDSNTYYDDYYYPNTNGGAIFGMKNYNHKCKYNFVDIDKDGNTTNLFTLEKLYIKSESEIEKPVKKGYKFAGWYLDKECTKKVNFAYYTSDSTETFYAKWN